MICRLLIILLLALPCYGQCLKTDLNQDGIVNIDDVAIVFQDWLKESNCMANAYSNYDGSTGYITVPNDAALNVGAGSYSFSWWQKGINVAVSNQYTFSKGISGVVYSSKTNEGYIDFTANNTNSYQRGLDYLVPASIINNWNFYCATYDSILDVLSFYVNSVLIIPDDTYVTGTAPDTDNTDLFEIGSNNGFNKFHGSLDDLRIYKSALTQTDISIIYNSGRGTKYVDNQLVDGGGTDVEPTFVMNFDTDFDVNNRIYDQVGNLVGARTPTGNSGVWITSGGTPFDIGGGSSMEDILEQLWCW